MRPPARGDRQGGPQSKHKQQSAVGHEHVLPPAKVACLDGGRRLNEFVGWEGDDVLLISRHGMSLRFTATDDALRPMGRSTE